MPTRIWGLSTAKAERRCYQPRARREPGNCGIVSAIGNGFLLTLSTIGTRREIWKRPTKPSNCGFRRILEEGNHQVLMVLLAAFPLTGPADLNERLTHPKRNYSRNPIPRI